jgi:hypothetical protein
MELLGSTSADMIEKLIVCYDTLPKGVHMDDGKLTQVQAFHEGAEKYMEVIKGSIKNIPEYEKDSPSYFVWNYNNTRATLNHHKVSLARRFFYDSDILVSYPENGYSDLPSDKKYVRVLNRHYDDTKVRYHLDGVEFDPDRWEKIKSEKGIVVKDKYELDGESIIVLLNRGKSGYTGGNMDPSEFAIQCIDKIRKFTNRPIIIRYHPYGKNTEQIQATVKKSYDLTLGQVDIVKNYCKSNNISDVSYQHSYSKKGLPPLIEQIRECHSVVTYGSSSAATALIEGKPLYVMGESCFFHDMSVGKLSSITDPDITDEYYHKRQAFFTKYIHTHYTTEEIRDGMYWKKLQ